MPKMKNKELEGKHKWITILTRECPLEFTATVVRGYSQKYMQEILGFDFGINNYQYVRGEIKIDLHDIKKLSS